MVLFKNKDEGADPWRSKYFSLLLSQEQMEKDYKVNEELLCKTIIRFALAVKGLDKELDPHFTRIRNVLKSGLQTQQLKKELDAFSNTLMLMEEHESHKLIDATLLFEFLHQQYPSYKQRLDHIEQCYNNYDFKTYQELFIVLVEMIDDTNRVVLDFSVDFPQFDFSLFKSHLLRLLDYAEVPPPFMAVAEQIKDRLLTQNKDHQIGDIFDDTVDLLLQIKKSLVMEQAEMANFLSKLTDELAELAVKATGVSVTNQVVQKKRNLLDESVAEQVSELQNKSANATQLEPLKQLVQTHLHSISMQIQTYKQQENVDREMLFMELQAMAEKVKEMETESLELKSKLDIAQHKATRDPLTHIPNRLAFEDRLCDEFARWKRHGQPFCMMIWDIDFFKKINDGFGHKSGDKALVVIAQLLDKQCRQTDFVARFGGEEFVMLLPNTHAEDALNVANKLRENVEKANFKASGHKISITLSCGISQILDGDSAESIFERADQALYKAKQNGRNQCVVI